MPVAPADLTYPTGELRPEWFPGEDLAELLALWIGEGYALAPEDATAEQEDTVARAHGYWRGYDALVKRMAFKPSSVGLSAAGISVSYPSGQLKMLEGERDRWADAREAALAIIGATEASTPVHLPLVTRAVPFTVSF